MQNTKPRTRNTKDGELRARAYARFAFRFIGRPQAPSPKLTGLKLQAASIKPQAASLKLKAASYKLHDP